MTTPSPKNISERILAQLTAIAPDIDPAGIDPERDLRDQFDFDSMDSLHFAAAISAEFAIEIAERDYPQLAALRKACDYVQARIAGRVAAIDQPAS